MINLREYIRFWDYMIRLYFVTLSTSFSSSNLYLVYLLSDILYSIVDSFFIYLSILQYKTSLVMNLINRLMRNLLILHLVVSESAK